MEIIESVFAAVLTPVFLIIGAGWAFNRVNAGGVTSEQARRVISALVMYIFYPALIFSVIPTIELDSSLGMAATFYAVSLCAGLSLAFLLTRILKSFGAPNADIGVVLLCAGLGNLISIGIPVVQHLLGEDGAGYAIATDIFVVTPFFWTSAIGISMHYGGTGVGNGLGGVWREVFKLPPVWAFLFAMILNVFNVPPSPGLARGFEILGTPTLAGLLLVVGMSLSLSGFRRYWRVTILVSAIKLIIAPAIVLIVGTVIGAAPDSLSAGVALSSLPTMMAIMVLAERYGLNVELTAAILFASTFGFVLTLPIVAILLSG